MEAYKLIVPINHRAPEEEVLDSRPRLRRMFGPRLVRQQYEIQKTLPQKEFCNQGDIISLGDPDFVLTEGLRFCKILSDRISVEDRAVRVDVVKRDASGCLLEARTSPFLMLGGKSLEQGKQAFRSQGWNVSILVS